VVYQMFARRETNVSLLDQHVLPLPKPSFRGKQPHGIPVP
jgi:hypothetical protein